MNRFMLLAKLMFNTLRYRFLKLTGWPGKLESISLEVTHRCICRCVMCNIWKISRDVEDLSLADLTTLLSSEAACSLREIDITGGEPFLRADLVSLLTWIAHAKHKHFPRLKTVAITTNGILTDKVVKVSDEVIGLLADQGIDLVIVCGLDAVNELHDEIRNYKNAWKKVSATISALEKIREQHPNLVLGVKTTIIPQNVYELNNIAAYAEKHGLFTIVSPRIITPNRFGNEDLQKDLSFSAEELLVIKRFYESPVFAWSGHREMMLGYLEDGKVSKPCSAGFNTVFVKHTGDVYPCPLIPLALGNIKKDSLSTLLSGATAAVFRMKIRTFPECQKCTEPGLERLAWPYEGLSCLKQLLKAPMKFNRLAKHMGIDKFF